MNKRWQAIIGVTLVVVAGAACVAAAYNARISAENDVAMKESFAREEAHHIQQQLVLFTDSIVPARLPFHDFLQGLGIAPDDAARLVASARSVFDFRHLRAVRYRIDADRVLNIAPQGSDFHSEIQTIPSDTKTVGVTGEIHGSLFNAVTDAGEKPELAMRLAEIFGWDLDFYTDPRPGDTFRVVVEKKMLANVELSSYGRILMAEYNNGNHPYRAVLFHDPAGVPAYYTPDGKSMKKAFLHSPLKFAAVITSHFSQNRFHPILKQYRPHLGIDYAAPSGTPVQTIGDGRVIFAGPKGGAGNLIEIQHTNGYTTYYMHLSRVLVRSGQRVSQGETI